MRLSRMETYLRYARMKIQEAEAALAEEELGLTASRCRDAAIALLKALASASYRWKGRELEDPPPSDVVKGVLKEFLEGEEFKRSSSAMERLLNQVSTEGEDGPSRIEVEELYSLAGELFSTIHSQLVESA